jgi:hypothetical protein
MKPPRRSSPGDLAPLKQAPFLVEARDRLASVYDWFTEGFDTAKAPGRQGAP